MKEHRITLRSHEVHALLAGAVSQIASLAMVRRERYVGRDVVETFVPTQVAGDLIWAGEDWSTGKKLDEMTGTEISAACREAGHDVPWCPVRYAADGSEGRLCSLADFGGEYGRPRLAHHLPRWLARFVFRVTRVRPCRLAELGDGDAAALGYREDGAAASSPLQRFRETWFDRHPRSRAGARSNPLVQLAEVEVLSMTLDEARELAAQARSRTRGRAA